MVSNEVEKGDGEKGRRGVAKVESGKRRGSPVQRRKFKSDFCLRKSAGNKKMCFSRNI